MAILDKTNWQSAGKTVSYLIFFTEEVEEYKELQQKRDYAGYQPWEEKKIFFL